MEPKRILIADDSDELRDIYKMKLELMGYSPTCVATGKDTLAALRSAPHDLALVDFRMPMQDGLDVFLELRRDPAIAKTPFVFMTAGDETDITSDPLYSADLGPVRCIQKGIDLSAFGDRVTAYLQQ